MVKAIYKNKPNVSYCKHPIIKRFYLSIILTNCARIYHKSPILNFIFFIEGKLNNIFFTTSMHWAAFQGTVAIFFSFLFFLLRARGRKHEQANEKRAHPDGPARIYPKLGHWNLKLTHMPKAAWAFLGLIVCQSVMEVII